MILEVREKLKELLMQAGISADRIFLDVAKAEQFNACPLVLIELGAQKRAFSGALASRHYDANSKKWLTSRRRDVITQEYRITIFGKTFDEAVSVATMFDSLLPRKFEIVEANGQRQIVRLESSISAWEETAGYLSDKERIRFVINATGGIFDVTTTDAVPQTAKVVVQPRLQVQLNLGC